VFSLGGRRAEPVFSVSFLLQKYIFVELVSSMMGDGLSDRGESRLESVLMKLTNYGYELEHLFCCKRFCTAFSVPIHVAQARVVPSRSCQTSEESSSSQHHGLSELSYPPRKVFPFCENRSYGQRSRGNFSVASYKLRYSNHLSAYSVPR
jgi:hypothetical protein